MRSDKDPLSPGANMAAAFDPYYDWLSISAKDQPPHHYRLLGLELFENNAKVIDLAADRQMAHVRSFQTGPNVAASQKLLAELSAARICLLDAQAKAKYDAQLRARLAPAVGSAAPAAAPPSAPQPAGPMPPKELRTRAAPAAKAAS